MSESLSNTDRELWREREGDFYADSVFVTRAGAIGISCGGSVRVAPLRTWFDARERAVVEQRDALLRACETGACNDDTTKLSFADTLRRLANELPGDRMSGLCGEWSDMLEAKADELEAAIANAKGNA